MKLDAERNKEQPWQRPHPLLVVAVGGGAALRSLDVSGGGESIVPLQPGTTAGLGVHLAVFPLQLADSVAAEPWADVALEGHFRRSLAQAKVRGGTDDGTTSRIDDDEISLRAGWRWRLGEKLPRLGVGAGWSSERAAFDPSMPVVSTKYSAVAVHLRAQQPILGEALGLELVGGPRFVLSGPEADEPGSSWEAELWLTSRPYGVLFGRAGARVTQTQLARADGLEVRDLRTFFALELGAFVQ